MDKDIEFGTLRWQNQTLHKIDLKLAKGEELNGFELAFIEVQIQRVIPGG